MDNIRIIWTVIIIHLIATITPGANFVITVRNSLTYSRKTGFMTVAGLMLGNIVYISFCLTGAALVISKSAYILNLLKLLGTGYLGYLGIKLLLIKNKIKITQEDKKGDISSIEAVKMGLIVLLTNPMALLFWISLFMVVIPPNIPVSSLVVTILIMIMNGFIWYGLVVMFFSQKRLRVKYLKSQNYFNKVFGGALLFLALRILLSD